jgi:hypothetical protein
MTLSDLIAAPVAIQRDYWLVMTADQRAALLAAQEAHGDNYGQVGIAPLADGRFAFCADQLSMTYPGGWFAGTWAALTDEWKSSIQITDTPEFLIVEGEGGL